MSEYTGPSIHTHTQVYCLPLFINLPVNVFAATTYWAIISTHRASGKTFTDTAPDTHPTYIRAQYYHTIAVTTNNTITPN